MNYNLNKEYMFFFFLNKWFKESHLLICVQTWKSFTASQFILKFSEWIDGSVFSLAAGEMEPCLTKCSQGNSLFRSLLNPLNYKLPNSLRCSSMSFVSGQFRIFIPLFCLFARREMQEISWQLELSATLVFLWFILIGLSLHDMAINNWATYKINQFPTWTLWRKKNGGKGALVVL